MVKVSAWSAASSSCTRASRALREAHLRLSRQHEALEPADRPCVLISDLVGIALDGPDDLARTEHELHLNKGAMK